MVELPITNICIVADRKNCPPKYTILDRTVCNDDADFWKDSFFKNKVTRYLCFTKEVAQNQLNQVVSDLALIGLKDPIPSGYTALTTTSDSREQALRKHVLCARFVVKSMTNAAIVNINLYKNDSYKEKMYTLVGEINGIHLTFQLTTITPLPSRPPPPIPRAVDNLVGSPPSPVTNNQTYQNVQLTQNSNCTKPMTGIEGVPFKLHDRLTKSSTAKGDHESDLSNIRIRTWMEVTELSDYDFTREKTIITSAS